MASDNRLFLIEFLVSKIKIQGSPPQFQDLGVHLQCGTFLDLDITVDEFAVDKNIKAANGEFAANIGKTHLFSLLAKRLEQELIDHALEIDLMISKNIVGSGTFEWKKEFVDMVKKFEAVGVVKSVNYEGDFDMLKAGKTVGIVGLNIKMYCLGQDVETYINLQSKDPIFVNPKTFQFYKCEKYDYASDKINPVTTLYTPVGMVDQVPSGMVVSWTEIFSGNREAIDTKSVSPMYIDDYEASSIPRTSTKHREGSALTMVSMCLRPGENKYFDLINLLSADVETKDGETIVNIALDATKLLGKETTGMPGMPGKPSAKVKRDLGSLLSVDEALTKERLNRKLCCNNDCEAIRKFNEHGIGPKYRPSGLGCYYEIAEPSTTYGMSHVNEDLFTRYGPNSFFRRPKDPYQSYHSGASKFHGEERVTDDSLCYCTPLPEKVLQGIELCCCCLQAQDKPKLKKPRVRGGGKKENEMKLCKLCKHIKERHLDQVRYSLRSSGSY